MIDEKVFPEELRPAFRRLESVLRDYGSMMVAYSGGVDSGLLAYVAHRTLGASALPVIGISPSLAGREEAAAIEFLERCGIPYERVITDEMDDENYRRNNPDRCYFCKHELFAKLNARSRERGFACIAYGANVDDAGDHRPGMTAAREGGVIAPLADAGLTKDMVRGMARSLELSLWDKPAAPCLASRVPYFERVSPDKLLQIERAEYLLHDRGFRVCRVRHHGELARIELPREQHWRLMQMEIWQAIVVGFKALGFEYVTLDLEGFRSGRLNDVLDIGRSNGEKASAGG